MVLNPFNQVFSKTILNFLKKKVLWKHEKSLFQVWIRVRIEDISHVLYQWKNYSHF